jgi:hypothetical protein
MKYVNVLKFAKKLEFEAGKLQAIVDDYHFGKNPLKLERNTAEEIANVVILVKYASYAVEGACLAINKVIPQDDFVGNMRGNKLSASVNQKVQP